jgi:N-acetylglucosaminyldiphosphoundecaprenol N-acetyl-beta-D-mannosaminyltransferase
MSDWRSRVVSVGSITIHDVDPVETDHIILAWLDAPGPGRAVCTPNVDYVVRATRDPVFRGAIMECDLRVPDGMWVVYASRIAGRPIRASVTGRLLLPRLAASCAARGLSVALVGAGPGIAAAAARRLQEQIPGLSITSTITPPTPFVIGSDHDSRIVAELAAAAPAIIFVALGAPRQEMWMATHRSELAPSVLVGVGQAFDVVAGSVREAPSWMTRIGLEWAFRLVQQPRPCCPRHRRSATSWWRGASA